MVVAGGGAGGNDPPQGNSAGGGGAGALYYASAFSVSVQSYSVVVGAGGLATVNPSDANGGPSTFGTVTMNGGGAVLLYKMELSLHNLEVLVVVHMLLVPIQLVVLQLEVVVELLVLTLLQMVLEIMVDLLVVKDLLLVPAVVPRDRRVC